MPALGYEVTHVGPKKFFWPFVWLLRAGVLSKMWGLVGIAS